jgi:hypothetical protein
VSGPVQPSPRLIVIATQRRTLKTKKFPIDDDCKGSVHEKKEKKAREMKFSERFPNSSPPPHSHVPLRWQEKTTTKKRHMRLIRVP